MTITVPMSFVVLCAAFALLAWPGTATDYMLFSDPPTVLLPGQNLTYDLTPQGIPYGPMALSLQDDCDLVLYFHKEKEWATNTNGLGNNCYLTLDSYGELLLIHNFHYPVWRSGKRSVKGEYVMLTHWLGGIAVYGPSIWSSPNAPEYSHSEMTNVTIDYGYYSYTVLPIGTILTYKNFKLVLEDDCNLVLRNTDTGAIKWQTNTYSPFHDCFTTMDDKGEFFIKHNRRDILWRSGVRSVSDLYILVLRYDGVLTIYGPQVFNTKPFW